MNNILNYKKKSKKILNKSKENLFELKDRIIFVIIALIVFRIGSFIPIPGIDTILLSNLIAQQKGTIIEMFNMFSGGALSRASIFSLGIMPHISASIIIQLLTIIHPKLSEIKKDGEFGRRKINKYTRYGTLFLAIIQSISISISLPNMPGMQELIINKGIEFYITTITSLVTGTIFLMWLGEQITSRGIGNGISILIFSGIIAGLPIEVIKSIEQARQGNLNIITVLISIILVFVITYFVVFIERGQRRVIVNYAMRQKGRKIYAAQITHLPLKVNMSGVIPAIFASSLILFPATIASWFGEGIGVKWMSKIPYYLEPGTFSYSILYASAIMFFCFFYTSLVFNSKDTADNLKKSGAFISGIRPGIKTSQYINKIMMNLTLIGATYIALICLMPDFFRVFIKSPFHFGGTSLLIVVVVTIDFMTQIQTIIMSSQYSSALKKANLKNSNR
ncbi:prlA [Wigglesworthia glossinidia endosymbiont of Glossina brevipalpis]|uniref:Protein translocase subunit SecY n=1 Tax=Wigglesworthia glossinidia brevipalpis TaxID=36870 RepID=Q8D1Z2_WIGBR|nr:prlA [Wigglesworthia glossinidia endosymbiont of Glossina brevipalpis]